MTDKAPHRGPCDHRHMVRKHPTRPFLKAWREHLDRTLEWVANEIGTSHTTVSRYEAGKSGVDDKTFNAIARAYGITPAELSAHPNDAPKAKELDRLLKAAKKLDAAGLATIASLAERLKPEV